MAETKRRFTTFQVDWCLANPRWLPVFRFEVGETLVKGRRSLHYQRIREAAKGVREIHGCYSWWVGPNQVYVGSFSPYGRKEFESGLEGRLHNYLQNHGKKDRPNTNKWVFDSLCRAMLEQYVELRVLRFEQVRINARDFTFEEATNDKAIILALESMLIASGRLEGGCQWNRT